MAEKANGSIRLNHLNPFWLHYLSLEKLLIEISDYVAITKANTATYSLKNMQLYFAICVETESVFEQIYKYINKGKYVNSNIHRNMNMLLNHFPEVRKTVVTFNISGENLVCQPFEAMFYNHEIEIEEKRERKERKEKGDKNEDVQPIKDFTRKRSWWRQYNGVKHQRYENFDQANLGNLLEALSALHVLNILLPISSSAENAANYNSTFLIVPVDFQPPMLRTQNYSLEQMTDGIRCYIGHLGNNKF